MKKKILIVCVLFMAACDLTTNHKSPPVIDVEDPHVNLFRENCISCHSVMNENSSAGGITMVKINKQSSYSLKTYYAKALKVPEHRFIDKRMFDTLLKK